MNKIRKYIPKIVILDTAIYMDICYVASDFTMLWIKVSRMGLLDVSAFDDDGLYYRNYSIDSKI